MGRRRIIHRREPFGDRCHGKGATARRRCRGDGGETMEALEDDRSDDDGQGLLRKNDGLHERE